MVFINYLDLPSEKIIKLIQIEKDEFNPPIYP